MSKTKKYFHILLHTLDPCFFDDNGGPSRSKKCPSMWSYPPGHIRQPSEKTIFWSANQALGLQPLLHNNSMAPHCRLQHRIEPEGLGSSGQGAHPFMCSYPPGHIRQPNEKIIFWGAKNSLYIRGFYYLRAPKQFACTWISMLRGL